MTCTNVYALRVSDFWGSHVSAGRIVNRLISWTAQTGVFWGGELIFFLREMGWRTNGPARAVLGRFQLQARIERLSGPQIQ